MAEKMLLPVCDICQRKAKPFWRFLRFALVLFVLSAIEIFFVLYFFDIEQTIWKWRTKALLVFTLCCCYTGICGGVLLICYPLLLPCLEAVAKLPQMARAGFSSRYLFFKIAVCPTYRAFYSLLR